MLLHRVTSSNLQNPFTFPLLFPVEPAVTVGIETVFIRSTDLRLGQLCHFLEHHNKDTWWLVVLVPKDWWIRRQQHFCGRSSTSCWNQSHRQQPTFNLSFFYFHTFFKLLISGVSVLFCIYFEIYFEMGLTGHCQNLLLVFVYYI